MEDNIIKISSRTGEIGKNVDKICSVLIKQLNATFIAYDNNMNKLITIEQIIKRALKENNNEFIDNKILYEIGKEKGKNYIKCTIKIDKNEINNIQKLIGKSDKKRNCQPFKNENKMEIENDKEKNNENKTNKETTINDLCIMNIKEFFE